VKEMEAMKARADVAALKETMLKVFESEKNEFVRVSKNQYCKTILNANQIPVLKETVIH